MNQMDKINYKQINRVNQLVGAILLNGKYNVGLTNAGRIIWNIDYKNRFVLEYSTFDKSFVIHGIINGRFFFIEFKTIVIGVEFE